MAVAEPTPIVIDQTTILSLLTVVAFIAIAYLSSLKLLASSTPLSLRILFIWHGFDALIHFIFEGSYLYNCFFTFAPYDPILPSPSQTLDPNVGNNFLGYSNRTYGSFYGTEDNAFAALWRVYADADKRWGGADPVVISLELLTVLGAGPLAVWVCWGIARRQSMVNFWMVVLATAELYGGFITFCPEWVTGNQNLDGSNWMFLWLYLFFFNMLWVFFPLYALYVAYADISNAFRVRTKVLLAGERIDKDRKVQRGKKAQ